MKSAFLTLTLATSALLAAEPAKPAPALQSAPSTAKVVDLRVESQTNPTAVNTPLPRFRWRTETEERGWLQKSYHILVASTPELLAQDKGDLWDSGEVSGRLSKFISYAAAPLVTDQTLHWKVRVKNREGKFTAWSMPATATIKLTGPATLPSPLFPPGILPISGFQSSDPVLDKIYKMGAGQLSKISSLRDLSLAGRSAGYHRSLIPHGASLASALQRSVDIAGFYPTTLPSDGSYGSTQSDAGVLYSYAYWWMTGDNAFLDRFWPTINAYSVARTQSDPKATGHGFGVLPADTLPANDPTPPNFVHLTSEAINVRLTQGMCKQASRNGFEMKSLNHRFEALGEHFQANHLNEDGTLKYKSLTAHLLALRCGLLDDEQKIKVGQDLLKLLKAASAESPFSQSPFAAANILPVLTWLGQYDKALAMAKAQDPKALSPLALAAISEWLISLHGGINSELPGFQNLRIQPHFPAQDQMASSKIWFDSPHGRLTTDYSRADGNILFDVTIPPNTIALIQIPLEKGQALTEGGTPVESTFPGFAVANSTATFRCLSGSYKFVISQ